jgi:predicted CoA-binding protein
MLDLNFNVRDSDLRRILEQSRVIAVVGASDDHYYTSYQVMQYLKEQGYKVYPVNPTIDDVDGERTYDSLADVPEPIDIVDVFRNADYLPEVVDEAVAVGAKVLWNQLDVVSTDQVPEQRAVDAGLQVVSNLCIRTEHERLKIPSKRPADSESF